MWLEATAQMGAEATAVVDVPAAARWLAERLGVPGQLVREIDFPQALIDSLGQALEAAAADQPAGDQNAA
jgi:hypothetical protein